MHSTPTHSFPTSLNYTVNLSAKIEAIITAGASTGEDVTSEGVRREEAATDIRDSVKSRLELPSTRSRVMGLIQTGSRGTVVPQKIHRRPCEMSRRSEGKGDAE